MLAFPPLSIFLHSSQSRASFKLHPLPRKSSTALSLHLSLGRLFLLPTTTISNRFPTYSTLLLAILPQTARLYFLSYRSQHDLTSDVFVLDLVTPFSHLSILNSDTSILRIAGLTTILYSFPFISQIPRLSHRTSLIFFQLIHLHITLCCTSSSNLPLLSKIDTRYLNFFTDDNLSLWSRT